MDSTREAFGRHRLFASFNSQRSYGFDVTSNYQPITNANLNSLPPVSHKLYQTASNHRNPLYRNDMPSYFFLCSQRPEHTTTSSSVVPATTTNPHSVLDVQFSSSNFMHEQQKQLEQFSSVSNIVQGSSRGTSRRTESDALGQSIGYRNKDTERTFHPRAISPTPIVSSSSHNYFNTAFLHDKKQPQREILSLSKPSECRKTLLLKSCHGGLLPEEQEEEKNKRHISITTTAESLSSNIVDLKAQLQHEKDELEELRQLLNQKRQALQLSSLVGEKRHISTENVFYDFAKSPPPPSTITAATSSSYNHDDDITKHCAQRLKPLDLPYFNNSASIMSSNTQSEPPTSGGFLEISVMGLEGFPVLPLNDDGGDDDDNGNSSFSSHIAIEVRLVKIPPSLVDPGFRLDDQTLCYEFNKPNHSHTAYCRHISYDFPCAPLINGSCNISKHVDETVKFDLSSIDTDSLCLVFLIWHHKYTLEGTMLHNILAWAWISVKLLRDPFKALRLPRQLPLSPFPSWALTNIKTLHSKSSLLQRRSCLGPRALANTTLIADLRFVKSAIGAAKASASFKYPSPNMNMTLSSLDKSYGIVIDSNQGNNDTPLSSMPLLKNERRTRCENQKKKRNMRTRSHISMDSLLKPVTVDVAVGPSIPMKQQIQQDATTLSYKHRNDSFNDAGVHHFHCVKCGQTLDTHSRCHMWLAANTSLTHQSSITCSNIENTTDISNIKCSLCEKLKYEKKEQIVVVNDTTTNKLHINPLSPSFAVLPTPSNSDNNMNDCNYNNNNISQESVEKKQLSSNRFSTCSDMHDVIRLQNTTVTTKALVNNTSSKKQLESNNAAYKVVSDASPTTMIKRIAGKHSIGNSFNSDCLIEDINMNDTDDQPIKTLYHSSQTPKILAENNGIICRAFMSEDSYNDDAAAKEILLKNKLMLLSKHQPNLKSMMAANDERIMSTKLLEDYCQPNTKNIEPKQNLLHCSEKKKKKKKKKCRSNKFQS